MRGVARKRGSAAEVLNVREGVAIQIERTSAGSFHAESDPGT